MVDRGKPSLDVALALAIAAAFGAYGAFTQAQTTSVTWDAVQYYLVTSQLAAGQVPAAEAPYVYRLGLPWVVAQFWPSDPARGFFLINLACSLMLAPVLALWLRTGIDRQWVRLSAVALFAAAWHAPIRYVHFNGGYVDPPFLLCAILALAIFHAMRTPAAWQLPALTVLTIAGTFVRETMILLPASGLLLGNPLSWPPHHALRAARWSMLVPIGAAAAVIAYTHAVVDADTTRSFVAAALQWIRKPPTSYVLAWFTAYGPILALLMFDWRQSVRDLSARQPLLAFLALCSVLAYFGGSDTERFLFWAMPIVYLLLGRAFERHLTMFSGAALAAGLIVAQAISARVFWTIPDPRSETDPLAAGAGVLDRLYAIADRVFVIDHFHFNLWSSFGSAPFRLVRLALYLTVTTVFVFAMKRRALEAGLSAVAPSAKADAL